MQITLIMGKATSDQRGCYRGRMSCFLLSERVVGCTPPGRGRKAPGDRSDVLLYTMQKYSTRPLSKGEKDIGGPFL